MPALIKKRIGLKNIPPPIPTIPDTKPKIHPIKIDSQQIEGALKLVITTFGSKPQPLFPNNRVSDYAIAISEALFEANSDQDVVFTLEGWYKQKGMSSNRVTSGRIFFLIFLS